MMLAGIMIAGLVICITPVLSPAAPEQLPEMGSAPKAAWPPLPGEGVGGVAAVQSIGVMLRKLRASVHTPRPLVKGSFQIVLTGPVVHSAGAVGLSSGWKLHCVGAVVS